MVHTLAGTAKTTGCPHGVRPLERDDLWHFVLFSHGFSFEVDFVGVMHQAVEDRVGQGGVADHLMPMFGRQLAGD